jgi:hypothetical protein
MSITLYPDNKLIRFWLMTNLTHSFSMYLFHAFTCFEQQVLIIRRTSLYQYIIWYNTLIVLIQVGPPDEEHLLLETCRGMK